MPLNAEDRMVVPQASRSGGLLAKAAGQAAGLRTAPPGSSAPARSSGPVGRRAAADWDAHARCWMAWPERPDNWRCGGRPAQEAFARVAAAIARHEEVVVCAGPRSLPDARALLPPTVRTLAVATDDAWMRDVGPTFVFDPTAGRRGLAGVDWRFNCWGGKCYADWAQDERVAARILEHEGLEREASDMVLEGGSILTDGEGTLLATEQCLLHPNRNPRMGRRDIERELGARLGVEKVIWLPRGLHGDTDTDGHVDNLAAFAAPGTVLLAWTDDAADPQHAVSREALAVLRRERDARGRELNVIKLPTPPPLYMTEEEARGVQPAPGTLPREAGERLPASYANFYLANGAVVMAGFGAAAADRAARDIVRRAFPGYEVHQVCSREILLGGGGIHCITLGQPLAPAGGR